MIPRFNVYMQVRQLRAGHVDAHYCAALFKYMRQAAVSLGGDKVAVYFVDDKAKVPIGEPGLPISTGVRGKQSLVCSGTTLAALDHDVSSKGSITPAVMLQPSVPKSNDESWYQGQVTMSLNDAVFQMSSSYRLINVYFSTLLGKYSR